MWETVNETCEVCQCSRLIKNAFQLTERYTGTGCNSFSHHSECVSSNYDALDALDALDSEDKENQHQPFGGSPVKHDNDISLYGNSSPSSTLKCTSALCIRSPSPKKYRHHPSTIGPRQPLEEFDINSQDSGLSISFTDKESKLFGFTEQSNASSDTASTTDLFKSSRSKTISGTPLFHSFSSGSIESVDDGFLELAELESLEDTADLPCTFSSLLKNETPVSYTVNSARPTFQRSISLKEDTDASTPSRARHCLFKPIVRDLFEVRSFKRPEPPTGATSPVQNKRYKCNKLRTGSFQFTKEASHPRVQRSFSANEAVIMSAVQRSSTDPDLIGDFTKSFCLPLVSGRHEDLKSITPSTLANLIRGEHKDKVASFKVIDCRYPYEYNGGHIIDAHNFFTKEQIMSELVDIQCDKPCVQSDKRHILVFHCEFSSERGPNLSRFLRNLDRIKNNDSYPALHYPELYLLDGGYKSFYEQYSELCQPVAYKSMLDPAHEDDLKHFRTKTKSWNTDVKGRQMRSVSLKRLGFS